MSVLISLKPIQDPSANLAHRLLCSAKFALASNRLSSKERVLRAIEILETAPEYRFISPPFDPLYTQLIPLYLENNYFEEAILHPDFCRLQLETFKTAFERFTLLINQPPTPTINFYLGVINLAYDNVDRAQQHFLKAAPGIERVWGVYVSEVQLELGKGRVAAVKTALGYKFKCIEQVIQKTPKPSREISEFLEYCQQQNNAKAIGRYRNRLIRRWLQNETAELDADFSYALTQDSGSISLLRIGKRLLALWGIKSRDNRAKVRFLNKPGGKLCHVRDSSGKEFLAKYEMQREADGTFKAIPLTPDSTQLLHARSDLILDWLEGKGVPPQDFFLFAMANYGVITLFQKDRSKCLIWWDSNPILVSLREKTDQVAIRFIDKEGRKIASIYQVENLKAPIAEYRIFKDPDGYYMTKSEILNKYHEARERGHVIADWLAGKIPDPNEAFIYYVREEGAFSFAEFGGKRIAISGFREFFLSPPLPSKVSVCLSTLKGEKLITVSGITKGEWYSERRLKLIQQKDGTYIVCPLDLSRAQAVRKKMEPIKSYLRQRGPIPSGFISLPVRRNGSVDPLVITGKQRFTLNGLAGCLKLKGKMAQKAADLYRKYPHLFLEKDGVYVFRARIGRTDIEKAKDKDLFELWEESHQALLSFREEKGQIIVEVHHIEDKSLVAEFEVIPQEDGTFSQRRLQLSDKQALLARGKQFIEWIIYSGLIPAGIHKYIPIKGEIYLFKHKGKLLVLPLGKFFLPDFETKVGGEEKGGSKYVSVSYEFAKRDFVREFIIKGDKEAGFWAEETAESRTKIDLLPEKLRQLFMRDTKKSREFRGLGKYGN